MPRFVAVGFGILFLQLVTTFPALADRLEDFVRLTSNPIYFVPENYHPDFRGEASVDGQTVRMDREQLVKAMAGVRDRLTAYKLTDFEIVHREEQKGIILVAVRGKYEATLDGQDIEVESWSEGILVTGGPLGYQWLADKTKEKLTLRN